VYQNGKLSALVHTFELWNLVPKKATTEVTQKATVNIEHNKTGGKNPELHPAHSVVV
jgi:hypothetical protein